MAKDVPKICFIFVSLAADITGQGCSLTVPLVKQFPVDSFLCSSFIVIIASSLSAAVSLPPPDKLQGVHQLRPAAAPIVILSKLRIDHGTV